MTITRFPIEKRFDNDVDEALSHAMPPELLGFWLMVFKHIDTKAWDKILSAALEQHVISDRHLGFLLDFLDDESDDWRGADG